METKMVFWDAHTHVQFSGYDADREEVMRRALAAGVRMVNVGTQRDTSAAAVALTEKYDGVYAAIGLHPVHTSKSFHDSQELGGGDVAKAFTSRGEIFDPEYYRALARHPKVIAIGECGLDYFRWSDDESKDAQIAKQKVAFLSQVALSREVGKPLMIHCRNAFADLIPMLRDEIAKPGQTGMPALKPGIIHFFTGTSDDARELLALGFSFTFGGVVTFARDYDEAIKSIPLDRILSETDAPYVSPAPYRGKRNEPAYVVETVKKLAMLKNISFDEMKIQIAKNADRIFNLP